MTLPKQSNHYHLIFVLERDKPSLFFFFFFLYTFFSPETRLAWHQFFIPFFRIQFHINSQITNILTLLLVASSNYGGVQHITRPLRNKWRGIPFPEAGMADSISIVDTSWKDFVHGQHYPARPKNHWTNSNTRSLAPKKKNSWRLQRIGWENIPNISKRIGSYQSQSLSK